MSECNEDRQCTNCGASCEWEFCSKPCEIASADHKTIEAATKWLKDSGMSGRKAWFHLRDKCPIHLSAVERQQAYDLYTHGLASAG